MSRARRCDLCNGMHPVRNHDAWVWRESRFLMGTMYRMLTCQDDKVCVLLRCLVLHCCGLPLPTCSCRACLLPVQLHCVDACQSLAAWRWGNMPGDAQALMLLAQVWDITEWAEAVGALPAYHTYANSHMWAPRGCSTQSLSTEGTTPACCCEGNATLAPPAHKWTQSQVQCCVSLKRLPACCCCSVIVKIASPGEPASKGRDRGDTTAAGPRGSRPPGRKKNRRKGRR